MEHSPPSVVASRNYVLIIIIFITISLRTLLEVERLIRRGSALQSHLRRTNLKDSGASQHLVITDRRRVTVKDEVALTGDSLSGDCSTDGVTIDSDRDKRWTSGPNKGARWSLTVQVAALGKIKSNSVSWFDGRWLTRVD